MKITENRVINGLLKGFGESTSPEELKELLTQDIEIVAPTHRATEHDLWPAIWTLASVLERQMFGQVYIRCGLKEQLHAPISLGTRCKFVDDAQSVAISIRLGDSTISQAVNIIYGDARLKKISVDEVLSDSHAVPSPIECFLLAGYLGFYALAKITGIPEYRLDLADKILALNYDYQLLKNKIKKTQGYTCIGLGQLGQAYLSLLYFLYRGDFSGREILLIDKDIFEEENGRTQIMLPENGNWLNINKVDYINEIVNTWGANTTPNKKEIMWGWNKSENDPDIALVGLDNFETRRMVCAAGFEHIIESGVGTNMLQPRISWHSIPGDAKLGSKLFPDIVLQIKENISKKLVTDLKKTPGECGLVIFKNISATAPCLGIAASAYALSELGSNKFTMGNACLWSPLLPFLREELI